MSHFRNTALRVNFIGMQSHSETKLKTFDRNALQLCLTYLSGPFPASACFWPPPHCMTNFLKQGKPCISSGEFSRHTFISAVQ